MIRMNRRRKIGQHGPVIKWAQHFPVDLACIKKAIYDA